MIAVETLPGYVLAFVEALPEPAVVHDRGRIVTANRTFLDLLGYALDELVARPAIDLVHPDDRELVGRAIASTQRNRRTPEHRLLARSGEAIPVEVTGVPFPSPEVTATLALVHDIRARKRHEAELAAAERMASLGRLAATVGHEINNPLTYVLGGLELLEADLARLGDARPLLARLVEVREGVMRVRDIVGDLKVLSIADTGPVAAVDLHRVLDVAVATAAHEIDHRARLVRDYGTIPAVAGTEGRLTQVFVNLLVNAAQAIPDGAVADHEIRIVTRAAGDEVTIEVLDTGHGLAVDEMPHLFEPFYSTRHGTGTGLGLAIAHRLVRSFGGTITAAPRVPRGASLVVRLPARATGADPGATVRVPAPAADADRRLRVLFVDDEPLICSVASRVLEDHDVTTRTSGRTAIEAIETAARPFDAIVCDLQMPDLGGIDVYEWVAKHRPELVRRIGFMSGGVFTPRARAFVGERARPLLDKPFEMDALVGLVGELAAEP